MRNKANSLAKKGVSLPANCSSKQEDAAGPARESGSARFQRNASKKGEEQRTNGTVVTIGKANQKKKQFVTSASGKIKKKKPVTTHEWGEFRIKEERVERASSKEQLLFDKRPIRGSIRKPIIKVMATGGK